MFYLISFLDFAMSLTIMIFGNGVLLDSAAFNYRVTGDLLPSLVTGFVKLDL